MFPVLILILALGWTVPGAGKDVHRENYLDGTLKAEFKMKNRQKNGRFTIYYESGKKKFTGKYELGKIHGEVTLFDQNGEEVLSVTYENGIRHGKAIYSYEKMIYLKEAGGMNLAHHSSHFSFKHNIMGLLPHEELDAIHGLETKSPGFLSAMHEFIRLESWGRNPKIPGKWLNVRSLVTEGDVVLVSPENGERWLVPEGTRFRIVEKGAKSLRVEMEKEIRMAKKITYSKKAEKAEPASPEKTEKPQKKKEQKKQNWAVAGRGFFYRNITPKKLLGMTQFFGEIQNRSGKNYGSVILKMSVFGKNGNLLEVQDLIFMEFDNGQIKSFSDAVFDTPFSTMAKYSIKYDFAF